MEENGLLESFILFKYKWESYSGNVKENVKLQIERKDDVVYRLEVSYPLTEFNEISE